VNQQKRKHLNYKALAIEIKEFTESKINEIFKKGI